MRYSRLGLQRFSWLVEICKYKYLAWTHESFIGNNKFIGFFTSLNSLSQPIQINISSQQIFDSVVKNL